MNLWSAVTRGKGLGFTVGILITMAFVMLRIWDPIPLQMLRLKTFDLYQQIEPREYSVQPVAIIDIDEASLAAYGQWPWPRTLVADLIDKLMLSGAAVVGFDMLFAEPDRTSPARLAETLRGIDNDTRELLKSLPDNEAVLAESLRRGRVVLGQSTSDQAVVTATDKKARKAQIAEKTSLGGTPRRWLFKFPGIVRNLPELEDAAAGIGMFTLKPEFDGIIRRVPMMLLVGDVIYPSLTVEMLRVATGQNTIVVETDDAGIKNIIVAGVKIPTDQSGRTWVNYTPHNRAIYISAKDVLQDTVPPERIRGHLLLVGTSAVGLQDIRSSPLDDALPGVEIHAQLLQSILLNDYLYRPNYAIAVELVGLVMLCATMIVMIMWAGAVWGLLLGALLVTAAWASSWYFYVEQGALIDVSFNAVVGFVLYSVLTYLSYIREEGERRKTRDQFKQYISPDLVEHLAKHPEDLQLGGEMKDVTIMFCDIRGFTNISELYKSDPRGLTTLINRFLTPMTDIILSRRGTIDKYMGDCIMAFWNAPLDDTDHALNACDSALAMMTGIKELNEALRAEAQAESRRFIPIKIGIGLNSGECCVGNMGSDQRFDYSVLGDDVNLASRLEGQSKTYGVDIVISENTYRRANDHAVLELDVIKVKGKEEAVRIYTLLGEPELCDDIAFKELNSRHAGMLTAYRGQRWQEARELAAECRKLNGGLNGLYDLYEERFDAFAANPPGADWDGVFVATTK